MTPLEYEERYHKLTVNLDGSGTTTVDVRRYQNNDAHLKANDHFGNREALKHKDQLIGKMDTDIKQKKKAAADRKPSAKEIEEFIGPTDSLVREVGAENASTMLATRRAGAGAIIAAQKAVAGMIHLHQAEVLRSHRPTMMTVHSGKGSPEEIALALHLVAKYKLYGKAIADPAAGVRDYCDKYIGLDCNGFVGNYARATGRSKVPNTPIQSYAPKGSLRSKIDDVQADDVLVWTDYGHIAVIQSIGPTSTGPDGKPARECVVVEATAGNPSGGAGTNHGGLQHSTYSIRSVGGDKVFLVERPKGGKRNKVFIAPLT